MKIPATLLAVAMAFATAPAAHAIIVDPSEAPNGCAVPAADPLSNCYVSKTCERSDILGAATPGTPSDKIVWTDSADNCNGPGTITHETDISEESSFSVTMGGGVDLGFSDAFKASITAELEHGLTKTVSKHVTVDYPPHTKGSYTSTVTLKLNRSLVVTSSYTCTATANALNLIILIDLNGCKDKYIAGASTTYSGGAPKTSTWVLNEGLVPNLNTVSSFDTCVEQPQ